MAWSHHTCTLYNQTWQKHLRVGRAENKHSQYEKKFSLMFIVITSFYDLSGEELYGADELYNVNEL